MGAPVATATTVAPSTAAPASARLTVPLLIVVNSPGLVAGADVDVRHALAAGSRRSEGEPLAVVRDRSARVVGGAVHRDEVERRRLGLVVVLARRRPDVLPAERAGSVRVEDELEPVAADIGAEVVGGAVDPVDKSGGAKRAVLQLDADVDVAVSGGGAGRVGGEATRPRAREEEVVA